MLDENRCTRKPKLLLVAKSLTSSIAANAPLALGYDHSDVSTPAPQPTTHICFRGKLTSL